MKSLIALFSAVALCIVATGAAVHQRASAHPLVGEPAPSAELSQLAGGAQVPLRGEPAESIAAFQYERAPSCVDCPSTDRQLAELPEALIVSAPLTAPAPATATARGSGWLIGLLFSFGLLGTVATAPRMTDERRGQLRYFPLAAATKIFQGVQVALDASGNAVNASDTAGLRVIGRAEETVDNTGGSAGDLSINVKVGTFKWANSGTQALDPDDKGKICFVEDNTTVAETSTHKVKAGRMVELDDAGASVWVDSAHAQVVPVALTLGSTNGTAGAAADLAALKAETELLSDDFRAVIVILQGQGIVK